MSVDAPQVSIIRVFVASPGDLSDERAKFRDVIEEVNRIKAEPAGIHLIAVGWEDTLPGKGRPQSLINQDVEVCDLFILLLWKRWGSETDSYSSGTEEEFELAKALNERQGGRPDILLYFKSVPDEMLADPGPQLQQVLKFRTKIEEERSFLYSSFSSADEWEKKFREHLCRWLDNLPPKSRPPQGIDLPQDITRKIEELKENLKERAEEGQVSESRLAYTAASYGLRAVEAAREGRFTEALALFATSLATYEHRDIINAYVLFMTELGKADLIEDRFKLSESSESPEDAAVALATVANYYARHGDLENAAIYYERARDVLSGARTIQFYSCFISYSHADKTFARILYDELQSRGIRCWLDQHQLLPGDQIYAKVDQGIRIWDKVLLCCSENSLKSWWVDSEIQMAFEKEQQLMRERGEKVLALIPLNLDDYMFSGEWSSGKASQIKARLAADFTGWDRDDKKFAEQLERLVRALRANP